MRTRKQELISDELKPFICIILKENRLKYNYSLEDLARALNYQKNRQTLHKYETGILNIPYDIFFEICRIFNIDDEYLKEVPMTEKEQQIFEHKMIKKYVNNLRQDKNLTPKIEKIINNYKNVSFEPLNNQSNLSMKMLDDSMSPNYLKGDRVFFKKQDDYNNGDDIVIAIKNNVLTVRRLYRYPKGIILQALNPKYQTINVNIVSFDMILGKVNMLNRDIK